MKLRDLEFILAPYQKVKLFVDKGENEDTLVIEKEWIKIGPHMNDEVISIWSSDDDTLGIRAKGKK